MPEAKKRFLWLPLFTPLDLATRPIAAGLTQRSQIPWLPARCSERARIPRTRRNARFQPSTAQVAPPKLRYRRNAW